MTAVRDSLVERVLGNPANFPDTFLAWLRKYLRVGDDAGNRAAGEFPVGFYDAVPNIGNPVPSGTQGANMLLSFAGLHAGVDLLDVGNRNVPPYFSVKKSGIYCFIARIGMDPSPGAPWAPGHVVHMEFSPYVSDPPPAQNWATEVTSKFPLNNTTGPAINTIQVSRFMPAFVPGGQTYYWRLDVSWDYVGDVEVSGSVEVIRLGP